MAVNVSASGQGKGGISLGGNLDLGQIGANSPAAWSAGLLVFLLVLIVVLVMSLR